jgi:hypothetical protein
LDTTNSISLYLDLLNSNSTYTSTYPTLTKYMYWPYFIKDFNNQCIPQATVINSLITDHYPLFLQLNNPTKQQNKNNSSYTFVDYSKLALSINKMDWNKIKIMKSAEKQITFHTNMILNNIKYCTTTRYKNYNNKK